MVTFDSAAYVKSELKQIKSAADRDLLTKSLPTVASGGTSICSGLQAAFTVRRVPLWQFATVWDFFASVKFSFLVFPYKVGVIGLCDQG